MAGFRILAIILGLVCLAMALGMFFHRQPCVINASNLLLKAEELKSFVGSPDSQDMVVKQYLKYVLYGSSVVVLGLALMFFISAASPVRMRPFVVVVIIMSIVGVVGAVWAGINLQRVSWVWWGSDAAGSLILAILLLALFPKKRKKAEESREAPGVIDEE